MKSKCLILFVFIMILLSGCSALSPESVGSQIVEILENEPIDSQGNNAPTVDPTYENQRDNTLSEELVIHRAEGDSDWPTGDWTSTSGQFEPVCWEMPLTNAENMYLRYTVSNPRLVKNIADLNKDCFLSDCVVFHYTGDSVEEYTYPEFVDENSELLHDIKMVLIDVTVENPDAANNLGYQDPNGNILPNQYVFTITPIGMVSEEISFQSSTPAYYSLRNSCPEREDGFSVEPGKSVSFQLGYLISNRPDGSEIENSALGLTLEGTKSVWWFNLMLEDQK